MGDPPTASPSRRTCPYVLRSKYGRTNRHEHQAAAFCTLARACLASHCTTVAARLLPSSIISDMHLPRLAMYHLTSVTRLCRHYVSRWCWQQFTTRRTSGGCYRQVLKMDKLYCADEVIQVCKCAVEVHSYGYSHADIKTYYVQPLCKGRLCYVVSIRAQVVALFSPSPPAHQ